MYQNKKVVSMIPIKLNSERVKDKNIRPFFDGRPLVNFISEAVVGSKYIDEAYVYCSDERIKEYIPYIGHFHAAGNPGRHELYQSEIDYEKVFAAIKETGYEGCIGLEYFPEDDPAKGLAYAKKITC